MRILLVEDDTVLGDGLCAGLELGGYTVDWLTHGDHAACALDADSFDIAILDLALPGLCGMRVLRRWREAGYDMPVLVLTAYEASEDCVAALDNGADDYVIKPVELTELEARVRALTRRSNGHADNTLRCGELELNQTQRLARLAGDAIGLSAYEFKLLEALMEKPGRPVGRERFESLLYGWAEGPESNTIQVLIHNLRVKIGAQRIETIRGLGYRLVS